jgi:L-2-hydroxyglutarate oxidase LhgO
MMNSEEKSVHGEHEAKYVVNAAGDGAQWRILC